MTLAALAAAAALLAAEPADDAPKDPPKQQAPAGPFMNMRQRRAVGCPVGTHAVDGAADGRLHCVMGKPGGEERVLVEVKPEAAEPGALELAPVRYQSVAVAGLRADLPSGWLRTDAWSDDVPTLSAHHEARARGRPVTLSVSRLAPGQPGYAPLDEAVASEKESRAARELGPRRVSGRAGRQTLVDGESRTVYVDVGGGVYFTFTYSAPPEDFKSFEPAFERLLSSARLIK